MDNPINYKITNKGSGQAIGEVHGNVVNIHLHISGSLSEEDLEKYMKCISDSLSANKSATLKGKPSTLPTTAQVVEEIKRRADAKDVEAMYNRGNACYYGRGVTQDYKDAIMWYIEAAKQGYAIAIK